MAGIFWEITFEGGETGNGYLVFEDSSLSQVQGIYLADGTPVDSSKAIQYTTINTLPALPSWAGTIKTVAPPVAASSPVVLTAANFVMLFTPAETAAIRGSTDQLIEQWLFALGMMGQVDLGDPTIKQGIDYLVSLNLLTQARATAILAG